MRSNLQVSFFDLKVRHRGSRSSICVRTFGSITKCAFPIRRGDNRRSDVISFTLVGLNFCPSAAYAFIDAVNGAGSMHIAGPSALPGDSFSGYTAFGGNRGSRWGDYSAAVADGNNV